MCDCHPWSEEDQEIWKAVSKQPRTAAQWRRLHDILEQERRQLIEDERERRRQIGAK